MDNKRARTPSQNSIKNKVLLKPLDKRRLFQGVRFLSDRDPDLAKIADRFGPPPLWPRQQGFPTLVHIILEQQVSLASARAAFDRLLRAADPLTPERFLELDDLELKSIGFSRQKISYARHLSHSIASGEFNLTALETMDDEAARREMMKLKGVGRWTADIYLLMALLRPDVWPQGDLALAVSLQRVKGLSRRPTEEEQRDISAGWRPYRAVAARLLWQDYLASRGRL